MVERAQGAQQSRKQAPRPLRVALDTTFAGVNQTGVGLYSHNLAAQMRRLAISSGAEVRCYGPTCRLSETPGNLLGTMQEWPIYTQIALPLLLERYAPHVVHSTSHLGPLWGRGRLIVTVHDLIFRRYPDDYNQGWLVITKALLPRVLARAAAIIADSQTTKADIQRFYGIDEAKIGVIYPGIDEGYRHIKPANAEARRIRESLGLGDDRYILCLGPWVQRKNLSVVVEAIALLLERVPDVRLVITGSRPRGMKGQAVGALASDLPAAARGRVHTTGYLPAEELRSLVAGAEALAYPSRFEGFGLPPLEAMAAGVPVVVSKTPVSLEVTGGAALVAGPDAPQEWAAAFERILTYPAKAAQLKAAGQSRSSRFSWERCARETLGLYRDIGGKT